MIECFWRFSQGSFLPNEFRKKGGGRDGKRNFNFNRVSSKEETEVPQKKYMQAYFFLK